MSFRGATRPYRIEKPWANRMAAPFFALGSITVL